MAVEAPGSSVRTIADSRSSAGGISHRLDLRHLRILPIIVRSDERAGLIVQCGTLERVENTQEATFSRSV